MTHQPIKPEEQRPHALRDIRITLGLSQAALASRLDVSIESLRAWDSGRRQTPAAVMQRAEQLVPCANGPLQPLRELAVDFDVHVRTLRAAARDGRLEATFRNRAFFGRPVALATRESVERFLATGYGRSPSALGLKPAFSNVPSEYATRILATRARLKLTQGALARRIGAANRAVVYQWESGKRRPSPVFWARLLRLARP
jgi:DNA-binding transcriptional regulator YiaG